MSRLRCWRIDSSIGAKLCSSEAERGDEREDTFGFGEKPSATTFHVFSFLRLANDTCSTQTLLNPPSRLKVNPPLHPDGDSHSRFPFLLISEEVTSAENSDVFGK